MWKSAETLSNVVGGGLLLPTALCSPPEVMGSVVDAYVQ
jgi:hypothetical protein